ncbi:MAG: 3-phosphoserine/phosphohydroxythreonine transaminase [bacterium]
MTTQTTVEPELEEFIPDDRGYNFNPGPCVLPETVLKRIRDEFIQFRDSKTSILEVSHRSSQFEDLVAECQDRVRDLLGVPDNYHVLLLQGGASLQFSMLPMNLAPGHGIVQVVNSGRWSGKKITELEIQDIDFEVPASSEDSDFDHIPDFDQSMVDPSASYVHICSNETVQGTQWPDLPKTGEVPLVADMSSEIMARTFDVEDFGAFYGGAQKNMGPAGVTLVVIKDELTQRTPDGVPTMLRYDSHIQKDSIYNTPPAFAIYGMNLVLEWVQDHGGVEAMEERSHEKSDKIYDIIDGTDFYEGAAEPESRSRMNITFRLPSEDLEEQFLSEAEDKGMIGLSGHRSVGGCRASLYNGLPMEAVETLADHMKDFERRNG